MFDDLRVFTFSNSLIEVPGRRGFALRHDPVPQLKGYLINVASNKNGVGYGHWVHIDGWSDKVLDYIVNYEARNG